MRSMQIGRFAHVGAMAVLACLCVAPDVRSQTTRATLTGTVTDPNGAVVPGAIVNATNIATNISSGTKTNPVGTYTFTALPPGEYTVAVEVPGFKRSLQTGIVLQIAETSRLDIPLEVGAVTEEVSVVSNAPLVRSTSSEQGQVIDYKQIQSLPLNGRLFQQLITLTPGAIPAGFADFAENPAGAGARSFVHHSVNGLPWSGNNYLLDGVANNEPLNAFVNITPPLEALQEFKVQTNNPTAEFGVFGGAVVNLSIRSGTNQFSGSLFEYYRDDSLNARNFFAATKAPFSSNQFGGTFGGPLRRNKAFFFGDYQRLRQDQGRTVVATVPTAEMRRGELTAFSTPIFDPLTRQPFADNIIPGDRINPITRQVADIWPLPNRSGLVDNYVENNVVEQEQDAFDIRGDVSLARWGSVFGRYSRADRDFLEPPTANIFMAGGNRSESGNYNVVLGHTFTLSSSRLNELRFGINKYDLAQFGSDFGIPKNNELGIPNGNIAGHPYTFGIADFNVAGYLRTGTAAEIGWKQNVAKHQVSRLSGQALDMARGLAQSARARVTLLHVIETVSGAEYEEFASFYEGLQARASRHLVELASRLEGSGLEVARTVVYGKPAEEIVRFAIDNQVDLIVLASHRVDLSRPGYDWSTLSYKIGLLASCPVLLVK
jgi:nucleotide-binding universal stress UspA family protein